MKRIYPRTTFLWIFVHYCFHRPWATVGTKKMATLGAPAYNLVYYSSSLIIVAHRQWLKIPWLGRRRRRQVSAERASSLYYCTCARIIKIIIIYIFILLRWGGEALPVTDQSRVVSTTPYGWRLQLLSLLCRYKYDKYCYLK